MSTHDLHRERLPFPRPEMPGMENERRDAAEHRRQILLVARRLFGEHGADRVSMHQIAQAAQVGQGTLYRRFAHKGLLCMALLEEGIVNFQQEMFAYLERAGETTPALERLFYILEQLVYFNEQNAALLGAITDAASGERRSHPYCSAFYRWLRQVVIALLERAKAGKEVGGMDIDYVADVVLAPLAIDFYLYQRQELGFSPERIAEGLQHILRYGLSVTIDRSVSGGI